MAAMHAALTDLRAAARLAHHHYVVCRGHQPRHVAPDDVRLAVDGGGYHSAAQAMRGGNEVAALHYGTLTRKLAGSAGMAGDDNTSEEFAREYDAAAQEAIDGLDDVVDAFATLCGLAGQSHVNHRRADIASVFGHPALDADGLDFVAGTVDVGSVHVASSLGANDSDLPAFWDDVMDHLEGYAWPNADTDRLRDAASAWRSAAQDVDALTTYCSSAVSQLESQDSPRSRSPHRRWATCGAR